MNAFKFDKDESELLTIEIDNKKYSFNPKSLVVQKACEKFTMCQKPLMEKLQKGDLEQAELEQIVFQSCSLVQETINRIIGKHTYDKIFANRSVDFEEHQKVMAFIFTEIAEYCKNNEHIA